MFAIAFDVETTGLEPGSRVVELAALKIDIASGVVTDRLVSLVNPAMPLPADVQAVHRIAPEALAAAPSTHEVLSRFLAFSQGASFAMAHYAPFDVGVISWDLSRCGLSLPVFPVVDTCDLAKAIKETANNKLTTLVEHYGIETSGEAHRAEADAEACAAYYQIASAKATPRMKQWEPDHQYLAEMPAHLDGLPVAVAEGSEFSFGYTDQQGVHTERRIIPYGWSQTKGALMVHGHCLDRGERRTFRADRMDGAV